MGRHQDSHHEHDDRARRHPLLSTALGLVLAAFFINGYLRDARALALVVGLVVFALVVAGLYVVSSGAVLRRVQLQPVAVAGAGAVLVGIGSRVLDFETPISAAAVGVLAGVIPRVLPRVRDSDTAPLYVGAFAGMTSPVVLIGWQWLVLSGVLTGILWSATREAWVGVGGKMGTIAFAGVLVTSLAAWGLGTEGMTGSQPMYSRSQEGLILAVCLASALLTWWLAFRRGWGPVLSSGLTTLIAALILAAGMAMELGLAHQTLAAAWFGASFVGMTAPARLEGTWWMLPLMALVFTALFILFQARLAGLGGDLGATAASAVIAVIGLRRLAHVLSRRRSAALV